jgi:DNA-directed RNA polymerase specialized sigma subunit
MEQEFEIWKKNPTPENMGKLLDKAAPTLNSGVQSYAQGNSAMKPHAKMLAIKAFKSYDPSKGTKLNTHLMTQLQPLSRIHKESTTAVHVPERIQADLYNMNQSYQKFQDQFNREPSDQELADHSGLSMKRLRHIRKHQGGEYIESQLTENDEGDEGVFYPGTEKPDHNQILMEYLHHDLHPIDQKILEWRTGYNGKSKLSTNDIAKRLNLTPSAVSQRAARIAKQMSDLQGIEL